MVNAHSCIIDFIGAVWFFRRVFLSLFLFPSFCERYSLKYFPPRAEFLEMRRNSRDLSRSLLSTFSLFSFPFYKDEASWKKYTLSELGRLGEIRSRRFLTREEKTSRLAGIRGGIKRAGKLTLLNESPAREVGEKIDFNVSTRLAAAVICRDIQRGLPLKENAAHARTCAKHAGRDDKLGGWIIYTGS